MISFANIKEYATDFPEVWSFLWSPEEAAEVSEEHRDQIYFLNSDAKEFLDSYIGSSKMLRGTAWKPFNENYFQKVEEFEVTDNCENSLKKWLYSKPIPFDKFVYIDNDRSGQAVTMTWKMVIKYCEGLFFADDLVIFDETLNWGLYYFHEDVIYFGTDKIYDKELEYQKTIELNELKAKYFDKNAETLKGAKKKDGSL